jgi:Tfp pilus assembly protein PilN
MRAVNLIPADERRRRGSLLSGISGPTMALMGILVLALVVVLVLVLADNAIDSRRSELAQIQAQTRATQQQADALKPYADIAAARQKSLDTVRSLASRRFDWARVLADLSRRVPADVDLDSFDGSVSAPDASSGTMTGTATPASTSVKLTGCTTSHSAVARMMERMRQVDGVTDVAFGNSQRGAGQAGCPHSDQFNITLTLSPTANAPAAAAATSPESAK